MDYFFKVGLYCKKVMKYRFKEVFCANTIIVLKKQNNSKQNKIPSDLTWMLMTLQL